jgi:hypothetical protein
MEQVITGRPIIAEARIQFQDNVRCSVVNTETLGQIPLPVFQFSPTTLTAPQLPVHIPLITNDPIIKAIDSIHSVVCLTRGPDLLLKRVLHRVLPLSIYSILSFSLRLSSGHLLLLPLLPVYPSLYLSFNYVF